MRHSKRRLQYICNDMAEVYVLDVVVDPTSIE